jgi:hypothetical protein
LGLGLGGGVEEDAEGPGGVGSDLVILVEVDLGEERLVAEPAGFVSDAAWPRRYSVGEMP